jgi:hypothetical protein
MPAPAADKALVRERDDAKAELIAWTEARERGDIFSSDRDGRTPHVHSRRAKDGLRGSGGLQEPEYANHTSASSPPIWRRAPHLVFVTYEGGGDLCS